MDKIEWSDKFSVGVNVLDDQHKRLIEIINQLIENSQTESDTEIIPQALRDLVEYAIYHFNAEEDLMDKNDYPEYENHKEQHEEFKIKVVSYHSANLEVTITTILEYLKSWLIGHILKEDMKYKPFFNEKGIT